MKLVEALLAYQCRLNPGQEIPCLAHPHTLATLLEAMDSEVMSSLPSEEFDLAFPSYDLLAGEDLFSDYLAQFQTSDFCFSASDTGMAHPFNDAGTTLSEMLQTENILNSHRHRSESASSNSSVLTSLLMPPDKAPQSMAHLTSPTLTHILQSDKLSSSFGRPSPESKSEVLKRSDLASAAECATNIGNDIDSLSDMLAGENPVVSDVDNLSMLLDESASIFENGIAATDVGSLFAQFEEAAAAIPEEDLKPSIEPLLVLKQRPSPSPSQAQPERQPPAEQTTVTNPDSEIHRLLKAKRTTPQKTQPSPQKAQPPPHKKQQKTQSPLQKTQPLPQKVPVEKALPPPEIIEKIQSKSTSKRKLAIMLADPLPEKKTSRSNTPMPPNPPYATRKMQKLKENRRGGSGNSTPRSGTPPPIPLALQQAPPPSKCSSGTATPRSGSPLRIHLPEINLQGVKPAASASPVHTSSAPATAASKPSKKISIIQYKNRLQRNGSSSTSRSCSPTEEQPPSVESTVTQAAAVLKQQLDIQEVSSDYYDLIEDHDYCLNVPPPKEDTAHIIYADPNDLGDSEEVTVTEAEPIMEEVVETVYQESPHQVFMPIKEGTHLPVEIPLEHAHVAPIAQPAPSTTAMVSLLPSTEMVESNGLRLEDLDFSGPEGIEDVRQAMDPSVLKSLLVDPNLTEECKVQAIEDRAASLKNMETMADRDHALLSALPNNTSDQEDEVKTDRFKKFESEHMDLPGAVCKYRGKGAGRKKRPKQRSKEDTPTGSQYFDKLPSYFTDLPAPKQPGMPRTVSAAKLLALTDDPMALVDRDPSPDREEPTYSKMPAYFSCFTKSTKYDNNQDSLPPVAAPLNPDPLRLECNDDGPLVISTSRGPSRVASRSPSPCSRSSRSSRSKSKRSYRRRRRSYSSSSSSCPSSCSCTDSSSSSRSRSRSSRRQRRGPAFRTLHRSRSRLRSRSHSRRRSFSRSMSRDHTNRGSRRRRRSPSLVRRPPPVGRNTNKTSEIEERRIVYVGRIPGSYTRRDLRKKFEGFGDITDVSVHFREHGDNYGFVTFLYTCDAFACVEQGTTVPGCEHFDMCFGGRREFCKTNYADLDGNMEMEEEIGGGGARRPRNKAASLDFDDLLKQARKSIRR